jgi:uncharacterized membrane protein
MKHTRYVTQAALIAALYVVLTYLAAAMGLSSGIIQIRFSEALTILPYFMSSAVPGLFVGCILANLLTGCALWDIVFCSIATLIGAVITYLLRDKNKFLAPVAPILSNTIIVPFVLKYVYGMSGGLPYFFLTVFIGEVLSCGVLGMILLYSLEKHKKYLK